MSIRSEGLAVYGNARLAPGSAEALRKLVYARINPENHAFSRACPARFRNFSEISLSDLVLWLDALRMTDLGKVGGKNASLGEMIGNLAKLGVSVPGGFATTAQAFQDFSRTAAWPSASWTAGDARCRGRRRADRRRQGDPRLDRRHRTAGRSRHRRSAQAYAKLCRDAGADDIAVAVRSSATAEDLPDASFAGQQETFLNVVGIDDVLHKVKEVFASLYNDRAIAYRVHHGFKHEDVFLSAGVQLMVRSDIGASGVLFTLDTESGFRDVVFVTGSYGLGEMVVQGAVNPDEFYVYKPTLNAGKPAILRRQLGAKQLRMVYSRQARRARADRGHAGGRLRASSASAMPTCRNWRKQALVIEQHYGRPMDIEWAKDGATGKLYIVQARPETVKSRAPRDADRTLPAQRASAARCWPKAARSARRSAPARRA